MNLKDAWEKYEKTGVLSDEELDSLIESAESGLKYLEARGERFVSFKTILDLEFLTRMKRSR